MTPNEWQQLQRAMSAATVRRLMRLWQQVDRTAIGPSWDALVGRAVEAVQAGQYAAAERATEYVTDSLAAQVDRLQDAPQVVPRSFTRTASDGRPLATLLTLPASQAGRQAGAGVAPDVALRSGANTLVGLASTQVYDAGRLATGTQIAAHPQAGGWRRQLRGDTNCSRCIILAGKWFRWNRGFQRHPRCDCVHVPSVGPKSDYAGAEGFDPNAYFESLPEAEQNRVFTEAGAQAVRDGADLNQVVNARRGMKTTTMYGRKVRTTTEGTTRRASFGRQAASEGAETVATGTANNVRRVTTARLSPEQIYIDARDRDDAVRLLRRFGYVA